MLRFSKDWWKFIQMYQYYTMASNLEKQINKDNGYLLPRSLPYQEHALHTHDKICNLRNLHSKCNSKYNVYGLFRHTQYTRYMYRDLNSLSLQIISNNNEIEKKKKKIKQMKQLNSTIHSNCTEHNTKKKILAHQLINTSGMVIHAQLCEIVKNKCPQWLNTCNCKLDYNSDLIQSQFTESANFMI